jgi:catechol 2,3-dioxygenase-like lactoylglutathione lyase family enzyme
MIGYLTLGTNDLQRAAKFYDAVLGILGATRDGENERYISWAVDGKEPSLCVIRPFDGEPASAGNGTMVSLHAADQATVKALYAKVLELGGKDEGGPGPRGDSGFYAAYFRDLDGNKLAAFTLGK